MTVSRLPLAIILTLGCLALSSCGGDADNETFEAEPVPQELLDEIDRRQVSAAQAVQREFARRGIGAHSPIDCGVFPEESKGQRDSRCTLYVGEASYSEVVVVTLDAESNAVTSWRRSPLTPASGRMSVFKGWCPGDTESFQSSKRFCGEASTPDPSVNPAG